MKTGISQKIKNQDPWYTGEQLKQITHESQKRTISKRRNFILSEIEKFHQKKDRLKIIDAGCGDGVNLDLLVKIQNTDIWGVDYNPLRLERAKQNFPEVKIVKTDLVSLGIEEKFTIILCSQVLEHIREDEIVLKNFYHVLEDDGILILGAPNEGCFLAQIRNRMIEPYIHKTTDHVNFYTERALRKKIESAGFSVSNKMYENFFTPYQRLHSWLAKRDWGYRLLNKLGELFPSQAAGFYFVCKKKMP